jgi:putative transposase
MPRRARTIVGGYAYHVLNRANGRLRLFKKEADFAAFEQVLVEASERVPLRIFGYAVMGNHWHFVVWPRPRQHQQVTDFFRWLTVTHTQRWHRSGSVRQVGVRLLPDLVGERPARPFPGLARPHPLAQSLG